MVATLIICLGIVAGSDDLLPIRWDIWAGKIEREGEAGFLSTGSNVDGGFRGSPFAVFESRLGFLDIRKQRQEFANWVRGSVG